MMEAISSPETLVIFYSTVLFVVSDTGTTNFNIIFQPHTGIFLTFRFFQNKVVYTGNIIMNKTHLSHNGRLFQQVQYSGLAVMTAVRAVKVLLVI